MKRSAALALQLLNARCSQSTAWNCSSVSFAELHLSSVGRCLVQPCAAAAEHQRSSVISQPAWSFASLRHMAGRSHKLSLKRENNRASWAAVRPFLEQDPASQQQSDAAAAAKPQPIASAIPPLPRVEEPEQQRKIGCITGPYSITRKAAFAVVESGGAQFKVTADDVIYHNKIPHVLVNDVIQLGKVLMAGTQQETMIGRPFLPGASVIAAVEETLKDAKVHVFKKKKRKGYSKLKGHRSHITALRILEVRVPGLQIPAAASSSSSQQPQQQQLAQGTVPISSSMKGAPAVGSVRSIGPAAAQKSSSGSS